MSKHLLSGSAHLIEALIFSFLIATSIMFGLSAAEHIMGINSSNQSYESEYMDCNDPISEHWFILIVPITSLGWAAGFRPLYADMPLMALHGTISFAVSFGVERASSYDGNVASFVAALTTSTVAGLFSRFTGRQALGDTFTGLYALVPGIFITQGFFALGFRQDEDETTLFFNLLLKAVVIGVGAWFGTLLCAPTYLGTNAGILATQFKDVEGDNVGAMLFI